VLFGTTLALGSGSLGDKRMDEILPVANITQPVRVICTGELQNCAAKWSFMMYQKRKNEHERSPGIRVDISPISRGRPIGIRKSTDVGSGGSVGRCLHAWWWNAIMITLFVSAGIYSFWVPTMGLEFGWSLIVIISRFGVQ